MHRRWLMTLLLPRHARVIAGAAHYRRLRAFSSNFPSCLSWALSLYSARVRVSCVPHQLVSFADAASGCCSPPAVILYDGALCANGIHILGRLYMRRYILIASLWHLGETISPFTPYTLPISWSGRGCLRAPLCVTTRCGGASYGILKFPSLFLSLSLSFLYFFFL